MAQLSNTSIYGNLKVSGNSTLQGNLLATDIGLIDTNSSHYLYITAGSDLTADRILTLTTGDAARTITLAGNITTAGDFITSGAYSLTFTTTNTTNVTLPTSGTLTRTADKLSVFAATTSAELAGVISDETGSGYLVYNTSPTFSTSIKIYDSDSTTYSYTISPANISANTALTLPTTAGTLVITDQASGKVNLGSTTYVTGTLPVGNGGTGATSYTAGYVLFGNGSSAISGDSGLFWDNSSKELGIGTTTPGFKLEVNGSFASTTKSFVIPHPTKEGMKLRYGSLEGPENGVYVRGRLTESNVIELPEYWVKLVDPNSITVQLTSIGSAQGLFVEKIEDNKVYVKSQKTLLKVLQPIDCYYVVFAERSDVEKLQVEL